MARREEGVRDRSRFSNKATGFDFGKPSLLTLRHAAGSKTCKYAAPKPSALAKAAKKEAKKDGRAPAIKKPSKQARKEALKRMLEEEREIAEEMQAEQLRAEEIKRSGYTSE